MECTPYSRAHCFAIRSAPVEALPPTYLGNPYGASDGALRGFLIGIPIDEDCSGSLHIPWLARRDVEANSLWWRRELNELSPFCQFSTSFPRPCHFVIFVPPPSSLFLLRVAAPLIWPAPLSPPLSGVAITAETCSIRARLPPRSVRSVPNAPPRPWKSDLRPVHHPLVSK